MKILNIIGIIFAVFSLVGVFTYACGSFCFATFDIQKWDGSGRGVIAFMSASISCIVSGMSISYYLDEIEKGNKKDKY